MSVYVIAGLPGAGKTTLARALGAELRERGESVALVDGNDLRSMLGRQTSTIICVMSSLDPVKQAWNRANIPDYTEIVLGDASLLALEPHFTFGAGGELSTEAMVSFIVGFSDEAFV